MGLVDHGRLSGHLTQGRQEYIESSTPGPIW